MYLCVDVGGSSIKYGVLDEGGQIIKQDKSPRPENLEAMYQDIKDMCNKYESFGLNGLALSMPGAVDSKTGIIGGASAYSYIHGPNIKVDLEKLTGLQVELENDANCAALAEAWLGAAKDNNDSCFIVSGTGIGGAVIKDKRIHKGIHLHGGEFGYMLMKFNYDESYFKTWSDCSTINTLKQIAKDKGIDYHTLDGKEVFDHYKDDPIYLKYVNEFYEAMAHGIFDIQYMYDPEVIVIGGAISNRDDLLLEIDQRLNKIITTLGHARIYPKVVTCKYNNSANLIGALYHFLNK